MPESHTSPRRRCAGHNRRGEPCQAAPLKDSEYCAAHDQRCPVGFGSRHWARAAGRRGGRPRLPRPTEVARRLVEENVIAVLRPYFRALGYDVELVDGGEPRLVPLPDGGVKLRKLCYFAGLGLGEDLGHQPQYYGPYSRSVEVALENETFAGDLDESMRKFYSTWADREGRSYTYRLTEQGNEVVAEIRQAKHEPAGRVDRVVKRLGELVPEYWQHPLSLAAKVDLILRQQGSMMADQIPAVAKGLGWDVNDDEVAEAVRILVGSNRVAPPKTASA